MTLAPPATNDAFWMERALALARETVALASPNPRVGCVLVRGGEVLGEGAHRYAELDHAEIVALKSARSRGLDPAGATAYVTLEPCSHHGRTGPCSDALIAARVGAVVVATVDPNPQVSGAGVARLRAAGIPVDVGVLQQPARALNDGFARRITSGRPMVTLKAALSSDGRLAPAPQTRTATTPVWLTGPAAREEVQRMRHASDAVVTGIGTVLADNPALTDRSGLPRRRPLLRVVLDSGLRLPLTSYLVTSAAGDLLVVCREGYEARRRERLEQRGARVLPLPADPETGRPRLHELLTTLAAEGRNDLLVEAGAAVNGAFLREGLVDAVALFFAEQPLGAGAIPFAQGLASPFLLEGHLSRLSRTAIHSPGQSDTLVRGYLQDPWAGR